MNVKHTLVAFLILLALGGAFYYLNRLPEKPDEKAIPKEDLFSFKAEDVEEFTLEEAGKPPATFRRRSAAAPGSGAAGSGQSQQWEITAPPGIAADSAQIQSFIEEIAGMQGTPVAVADPIQWSEYGFEPPARTYRFRLKNGKAFTFSIGG
ncbi:MAG TPA: hypothetical protein VNN17_04515, partial [Terriglobia bacterium]|nr:hypothetical protein [Terriglobia bacterium]